MFCTNRNRIKVKYRFVSQNTKLFEFPRLIRKKISFRFRHSTKVIWVDRVRLRLVNLLKPKSRAKRHKMWSSCVTLISH